MVSPRPAGDDDYRLDALGWLQFERLCELLLAAEATTADLHWTGAADRVRVAEFTADLRWGPASERIAGPGLIAVAWAGDGDGLDARVGELVSRLALAAGHRAATLFALTNLDAAAVRAALPRALRHDGRAIVVGPAQLGAALDRHAAVRAALPSVLGHRDLAGLISAPARAASGLDLETAQQLARVFWPTRAYAQARDVLERHRFVVLTGPPEMGKTAIAQMLALASMTDGWEAHECRTPDGLWRGHDPRRRQLFIADDAFGSTEYRPDAAERWAQALGRLLGMLDERHRLIWTSRPAPLRAGLRRVQRERHAEHFPSPGQVLVDASELDLAEKTLILFRHAKARGLAREARALIRSSALTIVEHPHFTPERIRRLVDERLLTPVRTAQRDGADRVRELLEAELAAPTEAMRTSFQALSPEHRDLLAALLDAPSGLIDERELAATVRRHHLGGLSRSPRELIDRLTDHFLRVTPLGIGWVHPSWRDLVIDELREDRRARDRFLRRCGPYGVALALSVEGGAAGARRLPLLTDDRDWSTLADRLAELVEGLEDHELAGVMLAVSELGDAWLTRAQRWEARELARDLVSAIATRWAAQTGPLSATLLDRWLALRAWCASSSPHCDPPMPPLGRTWAELYPASADELGSAELARIEEWLALAASLHRYDRRALGDLGFFTRDAHTLARLVVTVPATLTPETRATGDSILARIEALSDGTLAGAAREARRRLMSAPELESRWWTPEDLAVPPSAEPAIVAVAPFQREDVDRVLADL